MKFPIVLLLAYIQVALCNSLYIYSVYEYTYGVGPHKFLNFYNGRGTCKNRVTNYFSPTNDVSGGKKGYACDDAKKGACEGYAPHDIKRLEINTHFGHYTIYKDRGWNLVDTKNRVRAKCRPTREHDFHCNSVVAPPTKFYLWFICDGDLRA